VIGARPRIRYGGIIAGEEEIAAVERMLRGESWASGDVVVEFEAAVAKVQDRKYALFCNSGSSALLLALSTMVGRTIAMPALQFPTAYGAAHYLGLPVTFVDCDDSLNMDPRELEQLDDVSAVLFVHVAGNPTNVEEVAAICEERGWPLIEDNCEGFGGILGAIRVGNFGGISCTSTHAAHQISTGVGGLVFTDDRGHYEHMRRIRDWGRAYGAAEIPDYYPNYTFSEPGLNLQGSDILAAIGIVQLQRLEGFTRRRQRNHALLARALVDMPVQLPRSLTGASPSWYTFPFLTDRRAELREHLEAAGIETRTILTGNIARQPLFNGADLGEFPTADDVMQRGLWISVHPRLTAADVEYIAESIRSFFA